VEEVPIYEHALAIRETALGSDHSGTATSLNNFASLSPRRSRSSSAPSRDLEKARSARPSHDGRSAKKLLRNGLTGIILEFSALVIMQSRLRT
jgi:hypothetical protein